MSILIFAGKCLLVILTIAVVLIMTLIALVAYKYIVMEKEMEIKRRGNDV